MTPPTPRCVFRSLSAPFELRQRPTWNAHPRAMHRGNRRPREWCAPPFKFRWWRVRAYIDGSKSSNMNLVTWHNLIMTSVRYGWYSYRLYSVSSNILHYMLSDAQQPFLYILDSTALQLFDTHIIHTAIHSHLWTSMCEIHDACKVSSLLHREFSPRPDLHRNPGWHRVPAMPRS